MFNIRVSPCAVMVYATSERLAHGTLRECQTYIWHRLPDHVRPIDESGVTRLHAMAIGLDIEGM